MKTSHKLPIPLLVITLAIATALFATNCSGRGETLRYTIELPEKDLLKFFADNAVDDPDFIKVLEKSIDIQQQFPDSSLVTIFCRAWERELPDKMLAAIFGNYKNRGYIRPATSNAEVRNFLEIQRDDIREWSVLTITSRLDRHGCRIVERPHLNFRAWKYYDADTIHSDRIHIYLKNAEDSAAITQLISMRGDLAIYETFMVGEIDTSFLEEEPDLQQLIQVFGRPQNATLCHVKETDCSNALTLLNRIKAEKEAFKDLIFMPGRPEEDGLIPIFILRSRYGEHMNGSSVIDAKAVTRKSGKSGRFHALAIFLNAEGAEEFSRWTQNNINRQLATTIDGTVYSAPYVSAKIDGGKFEIVGGFTEEEAKMLANVLKYGRLSVGCTVVGIEKEAK
jgi:hypothetical protein